MTAAMGVAKGILYYIARCRHLSVASAANLDMAMTVAMGVAKGILYYNARCRHLSVAVAANLDMAYN